MKALRFLLTRHPLAVLVFVLALAGALALVVNGARDARDLRHGPRGGTAGEMRPLEPWMTPRYIERAYGLAPHKIETLFDLAPSSGRPPNIGQIADALGLDLHDIEDRLRDAARSGAGQTGGRP